MTSSHPASGNQGITSFFQMTKPRNSDQSSCTESEAILKDQAKDNEEVGNQLIEDSGESDMEKQSDKISNEVTPNSDSNQISNTARSIGPDVQVRAVEQETQSLENGHLKQEIQTDNKPEPTEEMKIDEIKIEESAPGESDTAAAKKLRLRKEKEEAKRLRDMEKQELKRQREIKKEQERHDREVKKERDRKKKEEQKRERERKREEEKRQRELKKEQDRRVREQKREEEKRKKLEEKLKKEAEKKLEEEQKRNKELAKDRAQLRIGNFFKKSNASKSVNASKTDFEKCFLPFYVKAGVELFGNFKLDTSELSQHKSKIDEQIKIKDKSQVCSWIVSQQHTYGCPVQQTAVGLMQLMTSKEKTDDELNSMLRQIPHKYIKFYENVRPPYMGTYSKHAVLPRDNPFTTEGTGFNYEYDSDWDWVNEEEEEGGGIEDLDDGEEEEEDEEQDEASEGEFDEFLDKEESPNPRGSKKLLGPLIPTIKLRSELDNLDDEDRNYFKLTAVEYLIEEQPFPICPNFEPKAKKRPITDGDVSAENTDDLNAALNPQKKKPKTLMTDVSDLLRLFDEVHESTFSLGTISEIAQKHLPHYSKEIIKNTVKEFASRSTGKGNTARKWMIKDQSHWDALKQNK